jgi:hypothetical protein
MEVLRDFFEKVKGDPRIGPWHVSLFVAIVVRPCTDGFYRVGRRGLVETSKIQGKTTYYKCLRELVDYGYLEYWPEKGDGESVVRVK